MSVMTGRHTAIRSCRDRDRDFPQRSAVPATKMAPLVVSVAPSMPLRACRASSETVFRANTGWTPTPVERIAGCLQYREYDVFTRQLMRLLTKRMGHPTDTSHDYDYTDWDRVERFGRELAGTASPAGVRGDPLERPPQRPPLTAL